MHVTDFRPVLERTAAVSQRAMEKPQEYAAYCQDLNHWLRSEVDQEFYAHWDVQPSPLAMTPDERNSLDHLGRLLYTIVERIVQMYYNGVDEVLAHFRRYTLFRPLMHRQLVTWQEYGRYDFIVDAQGTPIFIETNAAMASGYLPGHYVQQRFVQTAPDFLRLPGMTGETPDRCATFGEYVRSIMATYDQGPGVLAVLVDENHKLHEVEMIKSSVEAAGVRVLVGDAAEVEHRDGEYRLHGERIRATFNKFRLFGLEHHWSEGAPTRYHVFMEGLQRNAFLSINNFACLTVAEDKGIFAAMRLPAVRAAMTSDELAFVDKHTPASFALEPEAVDQVLKDRGQWVLKPRNDYRGTGIYSGRDHGPDEWKAIVQQILDGPTPYLAQARVDPFFFSLAHAGPQGVALQDVRLVGGVYFRHLGVSSIVARVSPHEVVNAITGAAVLPEVVLPARVPAMQPA